MEESDKERMRNTLPSEQVPSAACIPFLNLGPALSSFMDTIADIHASTLHGETNATTRTKIIIQ